MPSCMCEAVRGHIRLLFESALGDARLGNALEVCTWNVVVEVAENTHIPRVWENSVFKRSYTNKARSLLFNLKNPKTPHLKAKITAQRDLKCLREFVRMSPEQMYPELWAPVYAELHKRNTRGKAEEIGKDHVGLYQCMRCKSMRTSYTLIQTRSADEPSSAFIGCGDCGKRWKMAA